MKPVRYFCDNISRFSPVLSRVRQSWRRVTKALNYPLFTALLIIIPLFFLAHAQSLSAAAGPPKSVFGQILERLSEQKVNMAGYTGPVTFNGEGDSVVAGAASDGVSLNDNKAGSMEPEELQSTSVARRIPRQGWAVIIFLLLVLGVIVYGKKRK